MSSITTASAVIALSKLKGSLDPADLQDGLQTLRGIYESTGMLEPRVHIEYGFIYVPLG